jgi:hypothetical protein
MYAKSYYSLAGHDAKQAVDRLFHLAGTDIGTDLVYMYAKLYYLLDGLQAVKYAVDRLFRLTETDVATESVYAYANFCHSHDDLVVKRQAVVCLLFHLARMADARVRSE